IQITAIRDRINTKSTQRRTDASSLEKLPADQVQREVGLKGGVVARGGEVHFRDGRGGEVQYDASRAPQSQSQLVPTGQPAPAPPPPVYPTTGGTTLPNDEPYDSMYFEHYGVNPFIPTDEDALSTFAVDVDAASYTVARRYIDLGHLPPKEAVRVEEFVNFF